jgi:hypothetical protein
MRDPRSGEGAVQVGAPLPVGPIGRVAVDGDVVVGRRRGELEEGGPEPFGGEVPDRVVVPAQLLDDRCEPGAALEGELDLDRDPLVAGEDCVGQAGPAVGARRPGLRERAFAFPGSEPQFAFEQQAQVGDGLDVRSEAGVRVPGAVDGADESAAAAGEPDERGQVDGELGAVRPAGVAPAVAQASGGAVAAADQTGELVKRDRVLLPNQPQQVDVSLRDPVAALVSAPPPPARLILERRRSSQLRYLLLVTTLRSVLDLLVRYALPLAL